MLSKGLVTLHFQYIGGLDVRSHRGSNLCKRGAKMEGLGTRQAVSNDGRKKKRRILEDTKKSRN